MDVINLLKDTIMQKQHYSVADWDFLHRQDWSPYHRWDLFSTIFISPPSCLRFNPWPLDGENYALSALPQAQDLKAGSLTTYARAQAGGVGDSYFYIGVTGPGFIGIRLSIQKITGAWWRERYDWWQGYDRQNQPATLVLRWTWSDPDWINPDPTFHSPMSGVTNRVGIGHTGQSLSADKYFDDTEIWIPA